MRLLLGAFEPFGGEAVNPSMLAVERLRADLPAGVWAAEIVLPVSYARAWPALAARLQQHPPEVVLLTGQAGGRANLTVERVAINLDDSAFADNAGEQRTDRPVVAGGAAAYFTSLPARPLIEASRAAGIAADLSHSAGTFLCNHVLYRLCHHAASASPSLRCGFVHLPWLPEQAAEHPGEPAMDLAAMVAGLRAMVAACR